MHHEPEAKIDLAGRLCRVVSEEQSRLRAISEIDAGKRADGSEGWSIKQELGHLVDSATNNRMRFITAALQGQYSGPTYDGPGWVALGGYADMPWSDLVQIWEELNQALARVIERIPEHRMTAHCSVAESKPVSLEFLIDDYIRHMQHHLDHILSRDQLTAYPGAALGV